MEKYRYDRMITREVLQLSNIDVRKEVEKQGKHELAKFLLPNLESMEFGKTYVVGLEEKEEINWQTDSITLQMTAHFDEYELQQEAAVRKKETVLVGDRCWYILPSKDGEYSISLVRIKECQEEIAIVSFEEVYKDHSGNGYFRYLKKTGKTMAVSYEYLEREEVSRHDN